MGDPDPRAPGLDRLHAPGGRRAPDRRKVGAAISPPSTIAVLGASKQRDKFGNKCVRAYLQAGWDVYPVNRSGGEIEGLPVSAKLADVPVELDRISVYLPPPVAIELIPEMVEKGAREVWFNPGSADRRVLDAAREAGLVAVDACSIVDIGLSPSQFL